MGNPIPAQHPAVVLRSQYRNLRSLVAVLLVALAALTTTVVILSVDGDGTTSTTSVAGNATPLSDPFAARTQQADPQGGSNEASVAAAISQAGSRSYPTLADSFQSQTEQPRPVSTPDESKIAATLSQNANTGPEARARAWQEKLNSMTPQEREQAFGGR
jgi:hypothetical protein